MILSIFLHFFVLWFNNFPSEHRKIYYVISNNYYIQLNISGIELVKSIPNTEEKIIYS